MFPLNQINQSKSSSNADVFILRDSSHETDDLKVQECVSKPPCAQDTQNGGPHIEKQLHSTTKRSETPQGTLTILSLLWCRNVRAGLIHWVHR